MHAGDAVPAVQEDASISQAIVEMTEKRLGMTAILNKEDQVVGIYTDGDLRRTLDANLDPHITPVSRVMTRGGKHIHPEALAEEGMCMMQDHSIQGLLVIDVSGKLVGALNFQDLLKAGVV
jgi:arabinose-5-phosphate isomerase